MPTHDRWFLVPAEATDTDGDGGIRPKYVGHADVLGYSAEELTPSEVESHYPALVQTYPDVETWFVVRMYGQDDAGWQAINEIHGHQDTRTLADHAADVAPVLNSHFPDAELSGEEWAQSFQVNA